MVKVYIVVLIVFLSGSYFAVVAQNQNRIMFDERVCCIDDYRPRLLRSLNGASADIWTQSFLHQNRFKRGNYVLGHVSAVQPNVVVMSSVPNSNYGVVPNSGYVGVPNSYDRGSTVIVKMPNDVYNTRMAANPNVVTRI